MNQLVKGFSEIIRITMVKPPALQLARKASSLAGFLCALAILGCQPLRPGKDYSRMRNTQALVPAGALVVGHAILLPGKRIDDVAATFALERLAGHRVPIRGFIALSNMADRVVFFGIFRGVYKHLDFRKPDNGLILGPSIDDFKKVLELKAHESISIPFEFDLLEHVNLPNGTYFFRFVYDIRLKGPSNLGEGPIVPWSEFLSFEV